jgi:two-component system sensor histidine kinase/response regulator
VFSILITTICVQFLGLLWVSRLLVIRSKSLRQIEASLDDARQIKTDFLSNVSHELRTLMTGIKGYVDNMLDGIAGEITDKQARYLVRVKANADRLTAFINDLLDLSRIDRGRGDLLEISNAEFDVSEVIAELAAEYEVRAASR